MVRSSRKLTALDLLFSKVSLKLHSQLNNLTGESLLLDRLEKDLKLYILKSILEELKILGINISYYKLKNSSITYKTDRFLKLLLLRVQRKLNQDLIFPLHNFQYYSLQTKWLINNFEIEDGQLIKLLLDEFTSIQRFHSKTLPSSFTYNINLLSSILENIVLKVSEIVLYNFLLTLPDFTSIFAKSMEGEIYSLKSQKNNLYWNSYIKSTFFRPKYIHTSVYVVKIITCEGLCNKLLYLPNLRVQEEKNLPTVQFIILIYFEVVDFIVPKLMFIFRSLKTVFIPGLSGFKSINILR